MHTCENHELISIKDLVVDKCVPYRGTCDCFLVYNTLNVDMSFLEYATQREACSDDDEGYVRHLRTKRRIPEVKQGQKGRDILHGLIGCGKQGKRTRQISDKPFP